MSLVAFECLECLQSQLVYILLVDLDNIHKESDQHSSSNTNY